jgi:glycerol-3-phosphate acyltransferase PlsY
VAAAGVAVIVGHIFPLWLGFRGGKGVATGLGAFLALSPLAVVGSAVVFFLIFVLTRYVSLGSIIGAASLPFWFWLIVNHQAAEFMPLFVCALMGSVLIIAKHHANIGRLLSGTESKFK